MKPTIPKPTVTARASHTKRFSRSHQSKVASTNENRMSEPPMVGVPAFF